MGRLIERITPFVVMDILSRARRMPGVIHMEVGEPDLPPSERVREAYMKAVRDGRFFYTPATGLTELRERIADYYRRRYKVSVHPQRVIITPGTSGAFLVALSMFTDRDRRLLLPDPSYPCYRNLAYFLDSEPLVIPAGRETDYEITPEAVRETEGVGAVIVSSPSNPTGRLYRRETLRELITVSEQKGVHFISDEIYHGLVYEGKEETALRFSDDAVVINGFSKYFCMPGFRVGWMILPGQLVRKAEIIIQNIFIAANTPAQYAAVEAFDEGHLEGVRKTFRERRDFLYSALKGVFEIDAVPEGAFYIWADISRYTGDAAGFCRRLLEEKAVAVTPGMDFGSNETAHHIRFAYTRGLSELEEGVRRIREFLGL